MNKIYKFLLCILLVISMLSCNDKQSKITNLLMNWNGQVIKFPKSMNLASNNKNIFYNTFHNKANKIVVYFDSTGCVECKMKLNFWNDIVKEVRDSSLDVSIIFIATSKNRNPKEVISILKKYRFDYPVYIDSLNKFGVLNKLPYDPVLHTLLLDSANRIVLIGSPIGNDKMWKLYKDYIENRISKPETTPTIENDRNNIVENVTKIQVLSNLVNLGKFSFQSEKQATFQLKNTGKQPLLIQYVNTSCGCTVAKFNKKPIAQGETTTVVLDYKPNSLGYFSKTADVVCNVPEGYVRLKISGEVVEK